MPVLFAANHPNGLLDPLLLALVVGRPVRFLAKSTFFKHAVGRLAMSSFDAIPLYRTQDLPASEATDRSSRNEASFEVSRQALAAGQWLALFPEGTSHSDPQLRPLKTGAARIALSAAASRTPPGRADCDRARSGWRTSPRRSSDRQSRW